MTPNSGFFSFPSKSDGAVLVLNQRLVPVMVWMKVNKLKRKPDKAEEVLLVSKKVNQGIGI